MIFRALIAFFAFLFILFLPWLICYLVREIIHAVEGCDVPFNINPYDD